MNTEGHSRVKLSVIVLVVLVAMVAVIAFMFFKLKGNDGDSYRNVDSANKSVGTLINEVDKNDKGYIALHYPNFEDEQLNNTIKDYVNKIKEESNKNVDPNIIYFLDYSSEELFENYIVLRLNYQIINSETKEIKENSYMLNYDKKSKKLLKVDDILRLDYVSNLTNIAKNNNISVKEEVSSFENFMLGKDKVVFYFNDYKDQMDFKYADYKRYIKLQNVNIPSLAPTTPLSVKERKIDPKKPMIALTYDDGPSGAFTTAMLDVLAKENVSATFFTLGSRVKEYPELIKREYMDGHQIASHGYDHADLRSLDMNATKKQMFDTSDAIFSLTGYDPSYVRPPFGAESDNLHSLYDEDHIILWTVDTRDWATRNAEAIKNVVLENVTDGSIILMHDMYQPSIDATEQLIPLLKEKGYQMVTVDELIKYKYKK